MTVSDRGAAGQREDTSAQEIRKLLQSGPFVEVDYQVLPDEQAMLRAKLRVWSDSDKIDLILTTGGTGIATRDRTPEATRDVIEREVPGLAEAMRAAGAVTSPLALLSRGVAGIRSRTLIINLPGSPRGASESLAAIVGVLPHAIDLLRAEPTNAPGDWHS